MEMAQNNYFSGDKKQMRTAVINSRHALDEIIGNLDKRDLIKARIVLSHFSQFEEGVQRRVLYELNKREEQICLTLLVSLIATNPKALAKYPDISESILAKVLNGPQVLLDLLASSSGVEQCYCVELAGKIRLREAVPGLIQLLADHSEPQVLQAAIAALGAIGSPEAVDAITEIIYSGVDALVPPAIQALGQIASSTAMQRLVEFLGKDEALDMIILDIFAAIQDDLSLEMLNKTMQSRSAVLRNYSKGKLIALGSKAAPTLIANLAPKDPDLQIHSLNALMEIGDESAVMPIRKLINTQPANANVRFAAFEALANLPVRKGDYIWASGLLDPENNIRLAAARAIERTLDDVLAAGIRNMVKSQDEEAAQVVRAVLDSQAKNIFLNLIRHDIGLELITDYLISQAHQEIRTFFVQVLSEAGYTDLAQVILDSQKGRQGANESIRVCAVDDSRMILSIYRSVLNELGYDPELFHNPETALDWLKDNHVKFVCTDLNMPEMTGIDLTRALRKLYNKKELPIIMVTTQNDLRDHSEAMSAGVNCIASKPFDAGSLQTAIATII